METIISKNPCPFCGKKEWIIWSLDNDNEWQELLVLYPCLKDGKIWPLIDLDNNLHSSNSNTIVGYDIICYIDECVSCGALVQG